MPKSVSFTWPSLLCRMFSGLISLCSIFLSCRWFRPFMIWEVMQARWCGGTPWPPNRFLRSARLPRSINSSATWTAFVFLETNPAYHCTRCGQPSACTSPLISFSSCSRFPLSSTLTVLTATATPVVLILPFCTTPPAPAPKCELESSSMSWGESLYSWPSKVIPSSVETFRPVPLWRMVPLGSMDQVMETDAALSISSTSSVILGGILAKGQDTEVWDGEVAPGRLPAATAAGLSQHCREGPA
mmetsp:Transcript_106101/g.316893  ORF Transcript_106101/g.316893 Transcript_106101/m.316893 type:complete len:244 (+) Transcript_106101:545-1276(+)